MPSALGHYNELVAAILSALVNHGLKRQDLSSEDLFDGLRHIAPDFSTFDQMFMDAVIWLRDEGYVRFSALSPGTNGETCVSLIVPTALCLSVLEKKIDALDGKTGRQILAENSSGGTPASSYVRAGSFVGGILGGFTKSIS